MILSGEGNPAGHIAAMAGYMLFRNYDIPHDYYPILLPYSIENLDFMRIYGKVMEVATGIEKKGHGSNGSSPDSLQGVRPEQWLT